MAQAITKAMFTYSTEHCGQPKATGTSSPSTANSSQQSAPTESKVEEIWQELRVRPGDELLALFAQIPNELPGPSNTQNMEDSGLGSSITESQLPHRTTASTVWQSSSMPPINTIPPSELPDFSTGSLIKLLQTSLQNIKTADPASAINLTEAGDIVKILAHRLLPHPVGQ